MVISVPFSVIFPTFLKQNTQPKCTRQLSKKYACDHLKHFFEFGK